MSRVFIERFPHRPGGHCSSTALRDTLSFYGHEYTEDMVFGLGAGLGFIYYRNPEAQPQVYVGGRAFLLEENLADNLGFSMEVVTGLGKKEGWAAVKALLDKGLPVMVRTDVYYLDYLRAKVHFSGHRIVVAGYDEDAGLAFVADNDRDSIVECSLESLETARSSTWFPQPADNAFYRFEIPGRLRPIEEAIPGALREVARNNLTEPGDWSSMVGGGVTAVQGLAGLERLASEMPSWPELMDAQSLSLNCKNFYVSAEKGGTGYGGNFRRMYGRFLREAGALVRDGELTTLGDEFIRIGDRWSEMSLAFKDLSADGEAAVRRCAPIARELHEREGEALLRLQAAGLELDGGT